ncbi:hypothetical protein [Rothia amarae]|uniref:hypothetical protein n=1 Tax=Rothia amarae TaxID=169480 RepID=UPI00124427FF
MTALEILTIVGIVASVMAAGFALFQILLTREKSDVEWEDYKESDGIFRVRNIGTSTAYKVQLSAWTSEEIAETVEEKKVEPNGYVTFVLPERESKDPAPVNIPRVSLPHVSDIPPSERSDTDNPILRNMRKDLDSQWAMKKQMQDADDAMFLHAKKQAESQQVIYKVIWCSRRGVWSTYSSTTG